MAERSLRSRLLCKGGAVVAPDKELEDYARDCVRLAQLTDIPEIHERLLQMAREWMAAAMDELKGETGIIKGRGKTALAREPSGSSL